MSTEKMREEFEAAFVANLVERHGKGFMVDAMELLKEKTPSGEYENYTPFIAWWAWQASRAAIEVDLREAYQKGWDESGEGWNAEYPGSCHLKESWQRQRDESLGLNAKS